MKMPPAARYLSFAVLILMIAQASLGRAFPGAYDDPAWIEATWVGNDWFTLLVAAPLLAFGLYRRQSSPAAALAMGVLAYAIYNYAFYVFGARLNAFFPLYLLSLGLAAASLGTALVHASSTLREGAAPPAKVRRILAGYLIFLALGLTTVWLVFWAGFAFAGRATPVESEAFKVVAATDLLLLVPALLAGGFGLWRGGAVARLIAGIAAIQSALYLLVLTINSIVLMHLGLVEPPGELPMWGPLAAVTATAAVWLVRIAPELGPSPKSDARNRSKADLGG